MRLVDYGLPARCRTDRRRAPRPSSAQRRTRRRRRPACRLSASRCGRPHRDRWPRGSTAARRRCCRSLPTVLADAARRVAAARAFPAIAAVTPAFAADGGLSTGRSTGPTCCRRRRCSRSACCSDLLGGAPSGVGALVLLVAHAAVLRSAGYFVGRPFAVVWWRLHAAGAGAVAIGWPVVAASPARRGCSISRAGPVPRGADHRALSRSASLLLRAHPARRLARPDVSADASCDRKREQPTRVFTRRAAAARPAARRRCSARSAARIYYLQVVEADRYATAGRREPHQPAAAGAAARPHPRPLRRAARRQPPELPRRARRRADRRHRARRSTRSAR